MDAYTIDNSALVKHVIAEEYSDVVDEIVALHRSSKIRLVAPDYVTVESANVLWQRAQRSGLGVDEAMDAFHAIRSVGVHLFPQSELLEEALLFAADASIAVYDALFCVVARREDAPLITADAPLVNRLRGTDVRAFTPADWPGPI